MDLPDGMVSMGSQGSLLGGILLILFGGFGLAHTVFDVPLDWVSEWWPVAVIALGGYLIYKAVIADRKTQEK